MSQSLIQPSRFIGLVGVIEGTTTPSALATDASGRLVLAPNETGDGASAKYNITAATVIKATPGTLIAASVVVAGSAAGTINDCATTGAAAAANQIGTTPTTVGSTTYNWPTTTGLVVVPGTGQTIAVSFI